ncbi:MAG: DUF4010 domain-containing protein [Bryobacterales bacterium]|nr:DUF4010 domain-containing protein [Bryobacterales bacterium]
MDLSHALRAAAEALLIGFLVGAERESSREEGERQPGVRDFIVIALVGTICGLLGLAYLTVAALLSIAIVLAVFHFQASERSGVTTEMAAIATFCLGVLTTLPRDTFGPATAVAVTVVMVLLLEAKRTLHKFIRETVTETEFNDTLRFLAIIFVIYPVLPEGSYGPYEAFSPRAIWLFVILVCSISYIGYFLRKFLGSGEGLRLAGVLGGLASSTAATASFARQAREEPKSLPMFWQAGVLANAMQFPRVLVLLYVISPPLAIGVTPVLAVMTAAGMILSWLMARGIPVEREAPPAGLRNPFRLVPALKFGALFAAMVFLSKAGLALAGQQAVLWVAALGGSVDADAAIVAAAQLLGNASISPAMAAGAVLLALATNALLKIAIAGYAGNRIFARRLALAFAAMFGAGALLWAASGMI